MKSILHLPNLYVTNIQTKLYLIAILNFLDGILTYITVSNGLALELNPIINSFIGNFSKMLLYKILLPSLLIFIAIYFLEKYQRYNQKFISSLINITMYIYTFLLLNHLVVYFQVFNYILTTS